MIVFPAKKKNFISKIKKKSELEDFEKLFIQPNSLHNVLHLDIFNDYWSDNGKPPKKQNNEEREKQNNEERKMKRQKNKIMKREKQNNEERKK